MTEEIVTIKNDELPFIAGATITVGPNETKPTKSYENTIFKSSYWYASYLCQLFVNFGVGGHNSFSFITKKGKLTLVYNLTAEEKLSLLKNMISRLSPEELDIVLSKK